MYNVKRFIRHARKITKQGNVKFSASYVESGYSLYPYRIHRKMLTRSELLLAYDSVAEFLKGPEIVIEVDGVKLQAYFADDDDILNWVDVDTGELMLTHHIDGVTYTSTWAQQLYRYGKKGGDV